MHRVFRRSRPAWTNPEESIGSEFLDWQIKGVRCFESTGLVCDLYETFLLPAIDALLTKSKEELERGESKHLSVGFGMYMVGATPATAKPTIIIASLSVRQRAMIKVLIRNEGILSKHPAIQIKTLNKKPAVLFAFREMDQPRIDLVLKGNLNKEFIDYDQIRSEGSLTCGSSIRIGNSVLTLGGIIYINIDGKTGQYGLTAGHSMLDRQKDESTLDCDNSDHLEMEFDSDSDDFDHDDLNEESTSIASVSSQNDTSSNQSSPSPDNLLLEDLNQELGDESVVNLESRSSADNFLGLDYAIFPIPLDEPFEVKDRDGVEVREVALDNKGGQILAFIGKEEHLKGEIQRCPYKLKMSGWDSFQEVWSVTLESRLLPGHSGTWVVDAVSGNLFGHIVAGRLGSRTAFVLPAWKIFKDIEERIGGVVSLSSTFYDSVPLFNSVDGEESKVSVLKSVTNSMAERSGKGKSWGTTVTLYAYCLRTLEMITNILESSSSGILTSRQKGLNDIGKTLRNWHDELTSKDSTLNVASLDDVLAVSTESATVAYESMSKIEPLLLQVYRLILNDTRSPNEKNKELKELIKLLNWLCGDLPSEDDLTASKELPAMKTTTPAAAALQHLTEQVQTSGLGERTGSFQKNGTGLVIKDPPAKAQANNSHDVKLEPHFKVELDTNEEKYTVNKNKAVNKEKRKKILEYNRLAAFKSRQRRKQWLANLQQKVELLSSEKTSLSAQISQLTEEVADLKTPLLTHKDWPISQQKSRQNLGMPQHMMDQGGFPKSDLLKKNQNPLKPTKELNLKTKKQESRRYHNSRDSRVSRSSSNQATVYEEEEITHRQDLDDQRYNLRVVQESLSVAKENIKYLEAAIKTLNTDLGESNKENRALKRESSGLLRENQDLIDMIEHLNLKIKKPESSPRQQPYRAPRPPVTHQPNPFAPHIVNTPLVTYADIPASHKSPAAASYSSQPPLSADMLHRSVARTSSSESSQQSLFSLKSHESMTGSSSSGKRERKDKRRAFDDGEYHLKPL